jgi:hypothetical protein
MECGGPQAVPLEQTAEGSACAVHAQLLLLLLLLHSAQLVLALLLLLSCGMQGYPGTLETSGHYELLSHSAQLVLLLLLLLSCDVVCRATQALWKRLCATSCCHTVPSCASQYQPQQTRQRQVRLGFVVHGLGDKP